MIEELSNYISEIQKQFPLQDFVDGPSKGLHILLEVENGEVKLAGKEVFKPKKGEEKKLSDFLEQECLPKEMYIDFIDSHKAIRGKRGSRIRSATPFAIKFYKSEIDEEWKKWLPKRATDYVKERIKKIEQKEKNVQALKGEEKAIGKTRIISEKLQVIIPYLKEYNQQYFEGANKTCNPLYKNSEISKSVASFQDYLTNHIDDILLKCIADICLLNKKEFITILLKNASVELYENTNENYLKEFVFNTTAVDKTLINDQEFGLSNYNNIASDKKPYLQHLTSPFIVNNRISIKNALFINTFEKYLRHGAFKTNPLPIFIDQKELNNEVINVVKSEGNQVSFHKIIRTLYEHKKGDLGNYYLFYFWGGGLKDLDFVSSFSFSFENVRLNRVVPVREPENDIRIKNIFQMEIQILQPVFNNLLIQKRKDGNISYRYFDEIDNNPKYNTATTWNLTMKYRKAFYDFIYKSRRQSITSTMFHDIMGKGILDDIRQDEYKDKKHTKQTDIYNKLNIWFSLWNFFGQENTTNDLTMANKIEQLQSSLEKLTNSDKDKHIQTDEEFAFAAGQIIYYLLSQSKAANKTHALLEPFLQKTNLKEFKKAIANTFNAYKHEIYFGKSRFEKLCGEIMGYELEGTLKELMPIILAGYFSNSIIYKTSEQ